MIVSNELTASQMAKTANCHKLTIKLQPQRAIICQCDSTSNKCGWPRGLTALMIQVLCDHLVEKSHLYLNEMAIFL